MMHPTDLTELNKLQEYLEEHNYKLERVDKDDPGHWMGRHQIIVYNDKYERLWDAICQPGSYGCQNGLLEIYGIIVDKKLTGGDAVMGYLTAADVIAILEDKGVR